MMYNIFTTEPKSIISKTGQEYGNDKLQTLIDYWNKIPPFDI